MGGEEDNMRQHGWYFGSFRFIFERQQDINDLLQEAERKMEFPWLD